MEKELHAIVRGRVQMVMYRDYARRGAVRLGLAGTVRNLKDGTVEVVAQGSQKNLERFVRRLQRGSLLSKVEEVEAEWRDATEKHTSFTILF